MIRKDRWGRRKRSSANHQGRHDFHGSRPLALRDNWLVGKEWLDRSVDMVDTLGVSMMGKNPLIYRSTGPMCQMSYAEALEKDGTFGEVAKSAWVGAAQQWHRYGTEDISTSYINEETQEPMVIRLNEEEMHEQAAKKLIAQLDAIQPGLREKIAAQKRDDLTASQREALDTPPEKRTGKQFELAAQAAEAVKVTHDEVARQTGPRRKEAIKLAQEAANHERDAMFIHRYREIVNFVYWRLRAEVEQTDEMLAARKLIHQGDQAYAEASLEDARNAYQQGLEGWRKVLDKHPSLIPDQTTADDLLNVIKRYRRVLSQLDEPFPEKFILQDVLDAQQRQQAAPPAKDQDEVSGEG